VADSGKGTWAGEASRATAREWQGGITEGGMMDDELKQHLAAMEARIMAAIERLRADLTREVEVHAGEKRIDPVARKLEGTT
jgi:hypothetical protein